MNPKEETSSAVDTEWTFRFSPDEPPQPTLTIVKSLAWLKGVDHRELTPLGTVIDAEALDELITEHRDRKATSSSEGLMSERPFVSFEYEGCLVTVDFDKITIDTAGT